MVCSENRRIVLLLGALLGLLAGASRAEAGIISDLKNDWSDLGNPNGVWSYNDSGGPITIHQSTWATHVPWWSGQDAWARAATGAGHIVAWLKSDRTLNSQNTPFNYDLFAGDVNTHTWDGSSSAAGTANLSKVVWTAPFAGTHSFSGNVWQAVHLGRSADVAVLVDGVPFASVSLFDGDGFSRTAPFAFGALNVPLAAGDTIEVRFVTTSPFGTHVGVQLTVDSTPVADPTSVPEPSTGLLVTAGVIGLLGCARRCYGKNVSSLTGR